MDYEDLLKRYFAYVADREGPYFAPDEADGFSAGEVEYIDGLLSEWIQKRFPARPIKLSPEAQTKVLDILKRSNSFIASLDRRS